MATTNGGSSVGSTTGKVIGFALVIDPDNDDGKRERFEFPSPEALWKKVTEVEKENRESPLGAAYYTIILCEDGKVLDREGVDVSGQTQVGDMQILSCEDQPQGDDCNLDFNNYDGSQEREY
jgi:hypothetical protein